ncbi:filamentous hemagglutinin N-terminal domain-containing protein [Burkholderia stabilis]|uniref:filamentous hemagglutinin N-terminal domain-containing protein n=1 Tax=Burkholderia stabilis TaxID=95485 RepID=UPI001428D822|nr:filamentous hemagglutinin N-terminal domain-containing protein [Burkholderia stabilis]HDR9488741.1 filamentous hemagglutinin N-terminal domain-containing protein [Burkholderia stabilis]HDR9523602.1 filamentous hemagglutinin N-terminal domain-containing protein [Burkholderia stabilis]HDR9531338.1 filamentous hemagglutinin N-terminal domain-containing protein [Burkholderia stabilis]HDR9540956.1 filamentous hemagglutinin N-terminal domain-containing protein [Burkholderia stabilis]HDR9544100.1 
MKHQQQFPRPRAATPFARTALAAALTVAMPILAVQTASAQPALVADPSAANRPGLGVASNGTPIVDINAANAAGVSINRFLDYNVGANGLVLNNSVGRTNTQLAGAIDGNAQLGGRSAQVILNQVTGGNASVLAGATEVAGQKARVIVANPNGISVNGASFINANRASVVAGTVEFDQNGSIQLFRTDNGRITIDGDGIDARGQDQLDLVARTLEVNAAVQAKRLVAVGQKGRALIEQPNLPMFMPSLDSDAVDVAIDVSKLGSMHADSILMRGASAGVGVNVAGKVEALTGKLELLSDGKIRVAANGHMSAAGELTATNTLENAGTITGGKLTLLKAVANTGTLHADGKLDVTADVSNTGSIYGGSGVQIAGNLHQDAPGIVGANGKVTVTGQITGSGTISENMTKPPVDPEPPVAETKPPVDPEPPVAETKPPVDPEPPVAETKPPVDPEPPVAETKPPVDPEPPVAETKPPVDPEPPVAETKPPVDPEPPVAETKPPVDPEPPVAETKPPVEPEHPVAETEPPVTETNPKLVADPSTNNRPGIDVALNGTPLVDINAPNFAGISLNRFLDYNVGANGLVLNNSVDRTNTRLAGSIAGNGRLGGRSARVILNQVTGGNASVLAGTTEVAGQNARVIVANPNGISVNGASFVNANRVSLVAGTTGFDLFGNVARFHTDDGGITIDGAGLDARGANQLDLVSRTLKVDGAVQAKKLVAVAQQGTASIEKSKLQTTAWPTAGETPDVAIDVSGAGSLQANEISLVGASAKTGVKIAGMVDASAGTASIVSSGTATIESGGQLQAGAVSVSGALDNHGTVRGDAVDVSGTLRNDGTVRGRSVRIAGNVTNAGSLSSIGALDILGHLSNNGVDSVVSGRNVKVLGTATNTGTLRADNRITAIGNVTNDGTLEGAEVKVMGNLTNAGALRASDSLFVASNATNNGTTEGAAVKVMGELTNTGALHASKSLFVMGNATNDGTTESGDVTVMGNLSNAGALSASKSLFVMGNATNSGTTEGADVKVVGNLVNLGALRAVNSLFVMGNVSNNGVLHGGESVFTMGSLYNGPSGVTSSYGNVFSMGRVSGPGRVVRYMARP